MENDQDIEPNDLEVASVLADRKVPFPLPRISRSTSLTRTLQTPSQLTISPYRPATVATNIGRGNTETITPSEEEATVHHLAAQGELLLLEEHIKAGLDIDSLDCMAYTLLHWACAYGQTDIVDYLLSHGANPDLTGPKGEHCLHIASYYGFPDIIKLLVAHGVDVNVVDENGISGLTYATTGNHNKCVDILLTLGADITSATHEGINCMEIAVYLHHSQAQRSLEAHMLALLTNQV